MKKPLLSGKVVRLSTALVYESNAHEKDEYNENSNVNEMKRVCTAEVDLVILIEYTSRRGVCQLEVCIGDGCNTSEYSSKSETHRKLAVEIGMRKKAS